MKIMSIAGARPNFMKLAAIAHAIKKHNRSLSVAKSDESLNHIIVHTGQHYDKKMSQQFFDELEIPKPDINLEVGSGSHAVQTAEIMKRFEPVLMKETPDILLVVGDVNSTIACTLVASKIEYPLGHGRKRPVIVHVEAGLRSFDRDMPEEINRILTDAISDLLFVTEQNGMDNLQEEGVAPEKIHFVGNVMIDTLQHHLRKADESTVKSDLGIEQPYGLVTLHRPSNVDSPKRLLPLIECLQIISQQQRLIFPIHPRTKNNAEKFGLLKMLEDNDNISLTSPLGYLDFLHLIQNADLVITDSGGIQEETTVLNVPCITLRENTERPVTVTQGSNYLIGTNPEKILSTVNLILSGKGKQAVIPKYWDGKAGERIVNILVSQ
ncbi:MAG: UDP-N-acetylglucosamine 2-epimerase (non-hydrolyzing) [Candidatus Cloacimonadota bacterium]|nr:UDP-N-acetylglucosamine 2-epimerase (non-hydrolyzing) [Candidatus Cloacimonadota bacterium]